MPEILTPEEIHDFGVEIVLRDLNQRGYLVHSVNPIMHTNPQIIAEYSANILYIHIRTSCYPYKGVINNQDERNALVQFARCKGAIPYFASVGIANSLGETDVEMSVPTRGASFYVAYEGLELMIPDSGENKTSHFNTYNQFGNIAGEVTQTPNGKHVISANKNADINTMIMSMCMIFANNLNREQKTVFSFWAGLSTFEWMNEHAETCALAIFHFLLEEKQNHSYMPPKLIKALQVIHPQALPQMSRPLTHEIRKMFGSLFSE